jgi:hypothetical protein
MSSLWSGPVGLHLGRLHAQEQLLVLLVAFGPFLALVVVVLVLRHRQATDPPGDAGRDDEAHHGRTDS